MFIHLKFFSDRTSAVQQIADSGRRSAQAAPILVLVSLMTCIVVAVPLIRSPTLLPIGVLRVG